VKKNLVIALVILACLGVLYAAMIKHAPKVPPPERRQIWAEKGVPVETDRVIRGDIEQSVEVTGDIKALGDVIISAKISGRVASVKAREGDVVGKGQVIVILDQEDAQAGLRNAQAGLQSALTRLSQARTNATVTEIQSKAAIDQAKAALKSAEARLDVVKNPARSQERMVAENAVVSAKANRDNAAANFKRHQQLLRDGAISQSAYDIAETQFQVAEAQYKSATEQLSMIVEGGRREDVVSAQASVDMAREQLRTAKANASQNLIRQEEIKAAAAGVDQARAALVMARQNLSYTYVKAPISGTVAARMVEPGQVVAPGQSLGEIINLSTLYFKGDISETQVAGVRAGQSVTVKIDALADRTFRGVVEKVYPAASGSSRNFPVRVTIGGSREMIRPGMFARGTVVTGMDRDVLLVPKDAVEDRRGSKVVFVVSADKTAKRHDVTVVRENAHLAEIASDTGIQVGDVVVTMGRQSLQDGTKVAAKTQR